MGTIQCTSDPSWGLPGGDEPGIRKWFCQQEHVCVFEYLEISLLSFLPSTCNTGRVGRVLEGRALSFDPHGKRRDLRLIDRAIVAAYQGVQLHRSFMASWGHISNQRHFIFRIFALTEERMGVAILQAIEYETSQPRKVFRVIRRQNH